MPLISATVSVTVTTDVVSVKMKYNIGIGAYTDGTWNKGVGVSLPDRPDGGHTKSGGGGGGGGGGHSSGGGSLRWKPISHKDRKLVILIATSGGTLTVNGQPASYSGQTNGNRATFRMPLPGSAYGTNVKVVHSHACSWTIPNGASNLHGVASNTAQPPGGSTTTTDNPTDSNTNNADVDDTTNDGSQEGGGNP